jgi:hypothetical protein
MRASFLTVIAAAATLASCTIASASVPPAKPLVIDPQRQTVGSMRIGDPAVKFAFGWAPPDFGSPSLGTVIPESYQLWRNPPALPWAVVTFSADDQQHATAILYRGPFRTTKGDRNGTPLATVMKHWPSHGPLEAYLSSPTSPPRYQRLKAGSAYFFFNPRGRLIAIQVGTGSADRWMNERR